VHFVLFSSIIARIMSELHNPEGAPAPDFDEQWALETSHAGTEDDGGYLLPDGDYAADEDFSDGDSDTIEPLSHPEINGQPEFDDAAFNAEAQQRAAEFADQVERLAVLDVPQEDDDNPTARYTATHLATKGAQYITPDGRCIEVQHEEYDNDPLNTKSKLVITEMPKPAVGLDGKLRRVTLSRTVFYESVQDEIIPVDPDDISFGAGLGELYVPPFSVLAEHESSPPQPQQRRSAEQIKARTDVLVECQLPNSPNYYTEQRIPSDRPATLAAHMAARRSAGEPETPQPYSAAEHQALMALLGGIEPSVAEPQPLDTEFDSSWIEPTSDY